MKRTPAEFTLWWGTSCPRCPARGLREARTSLTHDRANASSRVGETDFGQSRFGHPGFGQSQFWPIQFWPIQFWPIQFWPIHFCPIPFWMSGPGGWGNEGGGPNPEKSETPKGGAPKGGGPKIPRFFFLSRHHFVLFVSLWVSSSGILVVFGSAGALKCARLEFSGCRVKPRRP